MFGGGGPKPIGGGALAPQAPMVATALHISGDMAWHVQYTRLYNSYTVNRQKSQSGNQEAVNTDFNYSRTLN